MTFPFAAGEIPSAGRFGEGPNTFTPVLTASTTNPNLGADGSAFGWWVRSGPNLITGCMNFIFLGTGVSGGNGVYNPTLPLPADVSIATANGANSQASQIGSGHIRDSSAGPSSGLVSVHLETATLVRLLIHGSNSGVTEANPIPWAAGDAIGINFTYVIEAGV